MPENKFRYITSRVDSSTTVVIDTKTSTEFCVCSEIYDIDHPDYRSALLRAVDIARLLNIEDNNKIVVP